MKEMRDFRQKIGQGNIFNLKKLPALFFYTDFAKPQSKFELLITHTHAHIQRTVLRMDGSNLVTTQFFSA